MTLADDRASDLAMFFDLDWGFAENVRYTPSGSDPDLAYKTVMALIKRGDSPDAIQRVSGMVGLPMARDIRADFTRGATAEIATVWLKVADATTAGYGDFIDFDGFRWRVRPAVQTI